MTESLVSITKVVLHEIRKRIIDIIVVSIVAFLITLMTAAIGLLDGFFKLYVLNALDVRLGTSFEDRGPNQPYSKCTEGEKLIGGHCLVNEGTGYLQNTGFETNNGKPIFRCVFSVPQQPTFKATASAICLGVIK